MNPQVFGSEMLQATSFRLHRTSGYLVTVAVPSVLILVAYFLDNRRLCSRTRSRAAWPSRSATPPPARSRPVTTWNGTLRVWDSQKAQTTSTPRPVASAAASRGLESPSADACELGRLGTVGIVPIADRHAPLEVAVRQHGFV